MTVTDTFRSIAKRPGAFPVAADRATAGPGGGCPALVEARP